MSVLGVSAMPMFAKSKVNLSNSAGVQNVMSSPIKASLKPALQADVFESSVKKVQFANNFRAGKTSDKLLNLDEIAKNGGELSSTTYANGTVKEKVLTNKNLEYKQTFYETGKPQSEVITEKSTTKSIPIKETNFYPTGKLKDNNEYDYETGKHLQQTFYENGNTKTEKIQHFSLAGWYDVRNTEYYSNGNVKTNVEHDTMFGRHYSQKYSENGELISEVVTKP